MSAEATGWVWKNSPYTASKLAIHLAVADVVNDAHGNEFWMSQSGLAEKARTSRKSVCEWFHDAIGRGLVECVRDNSAAGKPNCYRLLMPTGGVTSGDRGCNDSLQGGVTRGDTELKEELKGTKTLSLVNDVDESATEEEPDPLTLSAQRVLDSWVEATGRDPKKVKLNAKRIAAVKARLREGYSVDDLCAAARGISVSAWHMGDNPTNKKYDDLLVAIRDGERVEKFRDLWEKGGDQPKRSAVDTVLEMFSNRGPSGPALSRALTRGTE